jgi:hypothetical protein
LLAGAGTVSEAEAAIEQGIDVARRQNAKSWELRGAMSLARLRQQQGRPAARGGRPARPNPRLVHRRPRHRRPQGRQGAARHTDRAGDCRRGVRLLRRCAPRNDSAFLSSLRAHGSARGAARGQAPRSNLIRLGAAESAAACAYSEATQHYCGCDGLLRAEVRCKRPLLRRPDHQPAWPEWLLRVEPGNCAASVARSGLGAQVRHSARSAMFGESRR